jgi:hypothetical protein
MPIESILGKYEAIEVARQEGDVQVAVDQYGHVKIVGAGTAGSPSGGVQSVQGLDYKSSVTLTRTADTNAYTAGDVLGSATGSTAALTFANMGPSGGGAVIFTDAELEIDKSSVPSGMTSFRLYLYSVTPPSALGDNAAWDLPSGDRASFLGYIDLGTPVDLGSTLYVQSTGVNMKRTLASGSVFGYLVTNGGYTPASADVHKITLHAVGM